MTGPTGASIDRDEVARFEAIAATWWDEAGPMRVLHRFNPVRLAYIRDTACRHFGRDRNAPFALEGLTLVDIGCGGGVLSEPLARLGARVTGLDPAPTNVKVAQAHADAEGVPVDYRARTIEDVVAGGERFDIVLAMEVVEHVVDMPAFVAQAARAVKPGGLLFAATLNRTLRSFALAIVGAEYVLGWLPRGTHDWEKFVRPDELARAVEAGGLIVTDTTGVVLNPLDGSWRASRDTAVNYMITAQRPGASGPPAAGGHSA
ncbi:MULTISPECIES: bifunctional 2-polyprenyl-6-hydroxyphenol methylase/3-demethylubiquinol 3-O-methyltransferase UbiG [unclassified Methylobacterium]|uniref:bifunctional 2-polyprenyl-6-hydroxyphenol methylase/3-demethylubiquinol 3-O-methyltransferase UbiG n=1 Tax=unclassified Methylobacterium TaxID=2615210 RepID=UPI0006FCE41B|nr:MULTISPECIES: bifunctional 2-polyprenyl-6-hydroxyphenol methylase/3-demethylubiquinol 3-O-methyltransferase UbiG [unclassified Methylobacterium]KQO71073.1 3-demethylubiquinone-9 3-methyltransferase [Methylobacterium sp. Leaf89]KQO79260.1 3-demethylubiquinone-9 3-methyltransferase [Methylobacterium sp. Leaf88]KQP76337.1 3-demethylubiquinone-9 3-methyltransferase [Methylobacterium sp. Leaf111]KQT70760.1 3-demethylubiquinone-9 3-methyltransferase [Methylobacterium sp. Leaf465]